MTLALETFRAFKIETITVEIQSIFTGSDAVYSQNGYFYDLIECTQYNVHRFSFRLYNHICDSQIVNYQYSNYTNICG